MKIAIAQQNYHIGNVEKNTHKIIEGIDWAIRQQADLVVFSELCVCGYPPSDLFEFNDFIEQCDEAVHKIKEYTKNIGVLIGAPSRNVQQSGKPFFNSVYLLHEKEIKSVVHKTLLPNYDIFVESRYFEAAPHRNIVTFKNKKLAITIGEDIWNHTEKKWYHITPMDELIKFQPDFIINLSASPFNDEQDILRRNLVKTHTLKYDLPMIYCNTVGAQTDMVFDGGSLMYDQNGNKIFEAKYFEEDYHVADFSNSENNESIKTEEFVDFSVNNLHGKKNILEHLCNEKNIEKIHHALLLGIKDYFTKMNFTKAIIGASGGIDSAVVQTLAVEALGKENVIAVLMPSQFSTEHSVNDAQQLSLTLGNPFHIISIKNIYDSFLNELQPIFNNLPFDVTEENIQSRIRGNLLMAMANKFNYILLNTSNKSELAVGYGTLYGDMAGGLSVLGDVYKTQVYALAKYINREKEIIPFSVLTKPPSAELRPDQKDSDSLPQYDILDSILFEYIENALSLKEITAYHFDEKLTARIFQLVNRNEYKRSQFCPIICVSRKAFGSGRKMPIINEQ
jgi:NAD+ synthase (glutamine-hydrolysing)